MSGLTFDRGTIAYGFRVQRRVIGALILREMHTRFGRDNIGYLWLVGEPMLLASVIGLMHMGSKTEYATDISPLALSVLGYTIFIMFRGIVNRSEAAMEANAPLLYHRMVTIEDITLARALLEAGGTLLAMILMMSALVALGQANLPARPLLLLAATGFMFWISLGQSMIVTAISHDNKTVGRLVHVYTYFNIPLSGAFIQVEWIPEPYRHYWLYWPMPHIFELARYGQFASASGDYFNILYLTGWCLAFSIIGMMALRITRRHMHLS